MKKTVLVAGLMVSSLMASSYLMAANQPQPAASQQVVKAASKAPSQADVDAINAQIKKQQALLKETNKQVIKGFSNVIKGMKLIGNGKNKEAISALEAATGEFDVALAANPKLGLIPIDGSINVNEVVTTPAELKAQIKQARKLLEDYKVQAARAILEPLKDDIEATTVYLPMETYPDAIKEATKLLVAGDSKGAMEILKTALSTMVSESTTVPLALVRADRMIEDAAILDLEGKGKKDKELALDLLSGAEEQLQFATLLGYTDKHSEEYKDIAKQIKELKKDIKGGNIVERSYKKLKSSVKALLGKHSKEKSASK